LKEKVFRVLKKRPDFIQDLKIGYILTERGEILISSQEERDQHINRYLAKERLFQLLQAVLQPRKERIPTKPPRSAKEKRIKEKRHRSEIKRQRQHKKFY